MLRRLQRQRSGLRSRNYSSLCRWNPPITIRGCGWLFPNTLRNTGPFLHCMTHNETDCSQLRPIFHDRLTDGLSLKTPKCCRGWSWDAAHLLPTATTATSRHGWVGFIYCSGSWQTAHGLTSCTYCPPTCLPADFKDGRLLKTHTEREKEAHRPGCARDEPARWTHRTHMLNATYIWYSSIASTNCPHESKSVPFLKLACHFWIVLLTSDILAGRILAALSGQHSRGGDSSTGLQRQRRRRPGHLLSRGARIDRWHPDQALSACSP